MATAHQLIGTPQSRVDGPAKVTGQARYSAEFGAPGLLHGYVVTSGIARGRIARIDDSAARSVPGVVEVFTHENRPRTAWFDRSYQDQVGPPGHPFRPLHDAEILYSGQPVALVVADSFENARDAAALLRVEFEVDEHVTDLLAVREKAYTPPKGRSGIQAPPKPRGDARAALQAAPVKVEAEYRVAIEHHNAMEPHATTVIRDADGSLTVHDKIQGCQNSQQYVCKVFGLSTDQVRVVSPFVGGGFGSGLRPQYQLFLAVMATTALERSVRVVLTRDQMWTHVYRPDTIQTVKLGADEDGYLQSMIHEAVAGTSTFEDHQEVVVNWSGMLYECPNAEFDYKLARIDTYSPSDMRAPGATLGVYAIEAAMDELAAACGVDPIELRLRNYSEKDENEGKRFSSKELRRCYARGAEAFGWAGRSMEPRSMREGRELIGWGMATGAWEAKMAKMTARATLTPDGKLEVATASADIGTGTYTVLTQVAAETLGLEMDDVAVKLGDSSLPTAMIEGGSWTAASAGMATKQACEKLKKELFSSLGKMKDTPIAKAKEEDLALDGGRVSLRSDPSEGVAFGEILRARGLDKLEVEATAQPNYLHTLRYSSYTHSAIFCEVRVDEELGQVRVTRMVVAVAAGRIVNPKTARSQIIGGAVMAIGAALEEESVLDHRLGRFMNHNLAEYHVPVTADVPNIDVIFVDEHDEKIDELGIKGLGEIGIVGTAAAVANAVYHATGKRVRDLPITIDKLL